VINWVTAVASGLALPQIVVGQPAADRTGAAQLTLAGLGDLG